MSLPSGCVGAPYLLGAVVICTTYLPPCQWPWLLLQLALWIFSPSEYPLPCEKPPIACCTSCASHTSDCPNELCGNKCYRTDDGRMATEYGMFKRACSLPHHPVYRITLHQRWPKKSLRVHYSVLASPLSSPTAYLTTESL